MSDYKPREFWIGNATQVYGEKPSKEAIHVIEKSAYDELLEIRKDLIQYRRNAEAKLSFAVEALEKIYGESYPGACQIAGKAIEKINEHASSTVCENENS